MGEPPEVKKRSLAARMADFVTCHPESRISVHPHRANGPCIVPSDWLDPEMQKLLGPQCERCKENLLAGQELLERFCGPCYGVIEVERAELARLAELRRGTHWPPAA